MKKVYHLANGVNPHINVAAVVNLVRTNYEVDYLGHTEDAKGRRIDRYKIADGAWLGLESLKGEERELGRIVVAGSEREISEARSMLELFIKTTLTNSSEPLNLEANS